MMRCRWFLTTWLIVGCAVLLNPVPTDAATTVAGSITTDTTWNAAGSPYTISSDLTLYPGYTLTIEPGVTVLINAGVDLDIRGLLDIRGTETEPVTITGSVNPTNDWNNTGSDGIRINADQGGSLAARYVSISHLHTAFQVDCCYTTGLTFTIQDSILSHNTVGIFVYDGPGTVIVERTSFLDNTFAVKGVDISISASHFSRNTHGLHYTSRVNITCSEFTDNEQAISSASSATLSYSTLTKNTIALDDPWGSLNITNNTIIDNVTGLYTESSGTTFAYNNIYNNTNWNVYNGTSANQSLTNNWWNTTAVTTIVTTIHDGIDETGIGVVTIEPVLTAAVDASSICNPVESDDTPPPADPSATEPWQSTNNCLRATSETDNSNCWVTKGPVNYGTASYNSASDTTTLTSAVDQTDYVYRDIALRNVHGRSLLLIALTQTEAEHYLTGLPYLYGYQMTDSVHIEKYLQGQETLFNGVVGQWDVSYGLYPVESATVIQLRYFFMQASYAGTNYNNAAGLFKYPGVFVVDNEEQANAIIEQYTNVIAPAEDKNSTPALSETTTEPNNDDTVDDAALIPPTQVTLNYLKKNRRQKTVTLHWIKPTVIDVKGVRIDRIGSDGSHVTLTDKAVGAIYIDYTLAYRVTYTYVLSALDTAGNITVGVTSTPIKIRPPVLRHIRKGMR